MHCDFDVFRNKPASLWRQLKRAQSELLASQGKRQPAKSFLKLILLDEASPDYTNSNNNNNNNNIQYMHYTQDSYTWNITHNTESTAV